MLRCPAAVRRCRRRSDLTLLRALQAASVPEAIFNLIFMLFTVFLNAFIIGTLTLVRPPNPPILPRRLRFGRALTCHSVLLLEQH